MSVRRVFVAMLIPALGACAAVLGLRDIDADTSQSAPDAANDAEASSPSDAGDAMTIDAATDAPADARPTGSCGLYPTALLCDDFENADAASPAWRREMQGGVGHVTARPGASDAGPYPNLQDFTVGFPVIPDVGKAALAFDGLPTGRRSLRFSIWVPPDAYPDHLPIAAVIDATNTGVQVLLEPLADAGNGRELVVRDSRDAGGTTLDIGSVLYQTWTCVEIELDGTTLRAWQRGNLFTGAVSSQTATSATTAEVGLTWTFGGGPDSNSMHYDDVVVATGAVGCR